MTAANVKVSVDLSGYGKLEIDGHDISSAVARFDINGSPGDGVELIVQFNVTEIDITSLGDAQRHIFVNIPREVIAALLALGWKPPADDNRTYRVARPRWDLSTKTAEEIDLASPDAND